MATRQFPKLYDAAYRTHVLFHKNPPLWVPRCECCSRVRPELVLARPDHVPLVYDHEACYGPPV
jgi:hypothetical protein